jgi:HD-GYP domain-containing protein (c-di-GMP phosphodiesterase class II)
MKRFIGLDENEALLALIGALDARDAYRRDHGSRHNQVIFIDNLLIRFKINKNLRKQIRNAVLIHDIGMIGISDEILLKPGRLTVVERRIVESAPNIAAGILSVVPSLAAEREMILHQNECWDGSGYPGGLSGKDIPVGARFISVAQAVDAMTHDRAYRRARPLSYCLQELQSHAGTQFDPTIAKAAAALLCKDDAWVPASS